jgi:hypothetical protein
MPFTHNLPGGTPGLDRQRHVSGEPQANPNRLRTGEAIALAAEIAPQAGDQARPGIPGHRKNATTVPAVSEDQPVDGRWGQEGGGGFFGATWNSTWKGFEAESL